jgi:glycerate kinase
MLEQNPDHLKAPAVSGPGAGALDARQDLPDPLRILIAPDKFKGCLTAAEVAGAIRSGIESAGSGARPQVTVLPLADGGDGSVEAAVSAGFRCLSVEVQDADGLARPAGIAFDGTTAVVEVAGTCGLATLRGPLRPLTASSRGLGEAMLAAALLKPKRLVVALGGSASTDGGAGMLAALGVQFKDADGGLVEPCGGELERIVEVDFSNAVDFAGIEIVGASDVTNRLRGPDGAAHVFGPQKGADAATVAQLDAGLSGLVETCRGIPGLDPETLADRPGAGSAGGIGFGLLLLGGSLVSGADYFLDLLGFDGQVRESDLLITGEGRLDAQTADGKLISAVCARAEGTPVWAVVGCSALDRPAARELGLEGVVALQDLSALDTSKDPAAAAALLRQAGRDIIHQVGTLPVNVSSV